MNGVLLYVLGGWFILAGLLVVGLCVMARRRPMPAAPPTFDERVVTALLQPDHPSLPDDDTPFADQVQAWLLSRTPTIRPAFPEES